MVALTDPTVAPQLYHADWRAVFFEPWYHGVIRIIPVGVEAVQHLAIHTGKTAESGDISILECEIFITGDRE